MSVLILCNRYVVMVLAFWLCTFMAAAQDVDAISRNYALQNDCAEISCIGEAASFCIKSDPVSTQTTTGMVFCLSGEAGVWDDRMKQSLSEALDVAKEYDAYDLENAPNFAIRVTQVNDAQQAWLTYLNAQCEMERGLYGLGTISRVEATACWMRLTGSRVFELRRYDRGIR